ncbi:MAG: SGNH/GDSL hydrolase family protein, partial [Lachnospiraceae bacterium]|nr:SGNH/GDSL hydrolase family protein [Candidatus Merdinaster equi]
MNKKIYTAALALAALFFAVTGLQARAANVNKIEVLAGETEIIDEAVNASEVEVEEGASLIIHGSLSADRITLYGDSTLQVSGALKADSLVVKHSEESDIHVIDLEGRVRLGDVVQSSGSESSNLIITYNLEDGFFVDGEVSGGRICLDPYREYMPADVFATSSMVVKTGKGCNAEFSDFALYHNENYAVRSGKTGVMAGAITLYMVWYDANAQAQAPINFASVSDACEYAGKTDDIKSANIHMVKEDYAGNMVIKGGKKLTVYQDSEDAVIYVDGDVVIKGEGTILQISNARIRAKDGHPASITVKRKAGLQLTGTRIGNLNMASGAHTTINGDVCVMGDVTGNGNVSAIGDKVYVFMGDVTIHDLSVSSPKDKSLPEFRFLMNKKMTINGIVNMDAERIRKSEGLILSYAYMSDPDQISEAGDNEGLSGTIEAPFFVPLHEGQILVRAKAAPVIAGMFRVRNSNEKGKEVYVEKVDRYIRATHAKALLFQIGATSGVRLDGGKAYGSIKEAAEAINYSNDMNVYEISILEDIENADFSGGLPSKLRLLTSGAVNSNGARKTLSIKTKKDVLLLGHINIAFLNIDASVRTVYANDKDITLLLASFNMANLSHCNKLMIGEDGHVSIHKEGNTINEMQLTAESATLDCPQYAAFRADDLENSKLAFEEAPSKKATDDAYKRAVEYLISDTYEVPWNRVLFLGDSITAGVQSGVSTINKDNTYPEKFFDRLGVEVVNAGIGGSTVWSGGPDAMVNRCTDYGDNYDAIFVMGGINDWFYGYECTIGDTQTSGTFTFDYNRMLDLLCEKYPDADIFVLIPLEPKEHAGVTPYEDLGVIRNIERSLGKAHDCFVIDLSVQGVLCAADPDTAR